MYKRQNSVVIERNHIRLLWQEEGQIKAEFPTLHDLPRPTEEVPPLFPSLLRQEKQDVTSLLPDDVTIYRDVYKRQASARAFPGCPAWRCSSEAPPWPAP